MSLLFRCKLALKKGHTECCFLMIKIYIRLHSSNVALHKPVQNCLRAEERVLPESINLKDWMVTSLLFLEPHNC